MSDNELTNIPNDMSLKDMKSIEKYRENGCPGLVKITDADVVKVLNLYMSGLTYSEISRNLKIKKDIILYLSHRNNWFQKRLDKIEDISHSLLDKIAQSKKETANTLALANTTLSKYVSEKLQNYIATGDPKFIEDMDDKVLSSLIKSNEALDRLLKGNGGVPDIQINLNQTTNNDKPQDIEVKVEKRGDDEEDDGSEGLLAALVKYKRNKEN